jgi:hypothetical protein
MTLVVATLFGAAGAVDVADFYRGKRINSLSAAGVALIGEHIPNRARQLQAMVGKIAGPSERVPMMLRQGDRLQRRGENRALAVTYY